MDAFLSNCEYLFPTAELISTQKTDEFNAQYGGANPDAVRLSHILYVKYHDDPWWTLQPSSATSADLQISTASDASCAHCGMGCEESMDSVADEAMRKFIFSPNESRSRTARTVDLMGKGALLPAV